MASTGPKGVRARFADAAARSLRAALPDDPPPEAAREVDVGGKRVTLDPGAWPGAPVDRLPPGCDVVALGVNGHTSFFIDGLGQLLDFDKLGHDDLLKLFRMTPNYMGWAWPKWTARGGGKPKLSGVEVRQAAACLLKAAGARGLFDPAGRVRGRGAWADRYGRLIWHNGDGLWIVERAGERSTLKAAGTGEVEGMFYPRRPPIMAPWPEPVPVAESPARRLFDLLRSWNFERGVLDAVIALGGLGTMMLSGALPWRAHVAAMGERGTGKSALQTLYKGLLEGVLIDAANATEAGIRQHMGLDALPVAIDEFEASDDNRRAIAIIELARIACSGGRLLRGGQDHKGVEFQARNAFFCSGIILPPMKAQDRSRFCTLNLGKLDVGGSGAPVVAADDGRLLLRALMDRWHDFERAYGDWRSVLRGSGLDGRAQDTYGTLFAVAELMLGFEALEDIGLPVTEADKLGAMIAKATSEERGMQVDNWRACLEHLLTVAIEAWKGGEKPTIGGLIEEVEHDNVELAHTRDRLAAAGVALQQEADAALPAGRSRWLLCVPVSGPAVARLFMGTRWRDGGWASALKQGRGDGVVRPGDKVVKINRVASRCLVVDLMAYDKAVAS